MPVSNIPLIFDRKLHRLRRNRAAKKFGSYSFLKQRAAEDLADRLEAILREIPLVLDLGCHNGTLSTELHSRMELSARMDSIVSMDMSEKFARSADLSVCADEEFLPFRDNTFDAVVSSLSLHWVNDLPGSLIQICNTLKPDSFFVGQMFGGATLNELRECLLSAEAEMTGGAVMRVSPFAGVEDLSQLLQRTGFQMPVADRDIVTVRYETPIALLQDLRGMGETSAFMSEEHRKLPRKVLFRAMELYVERHGEPDGRVKATFEIITASGWSPGPNQPKPLRPGSAKARLADALGVKEQSAGPNHLKG